MSSGANIKPVPRQLGHASAAMTLDLYGHLYEDDLDALSDALDRRYPAATEPAQACSERA
jgi:integrase